MTTPAAASPHSLTRSLCRCCQAELLGKDKDGWEPLHYARSASIVESLCKAEPETLPLSTLAYYFRNEAKTHWFTM